MNIRITQSLCCTSEMNTMLEINYTKKKDLWEREVPKDIAFNQDMPWILLQGRTCGSCSWKCYEFRVFSCQLLQELPSNGELLHSRSQPLWDSLPRRVDKGSSTMIWSFCLNAGPLRPAVLDPEFPLWHKARLSGYKEACLHFWVKSHLPPSLSQVWNPKGPTNILHPVSISVPNLRRR